MRWEMRSAHTITLPRPRMQQPQESKRDATWIAGACFSDLHISTDHLVVSECGVFFLSFYGKRVMLHQALTMPVDLRWVRTLPAAR